MLVLKKDVVTSSLVLKKDLVTGFLVPTKDLVTGLLVLKNDVGMCILSLAGLTVSLLGSDVRYGSQAMSLGWILQHVACAFDPSIVALPYA